MPDRTLKQGNLSRPLDTDVIRTLIAEQSCLVRAGLAALLSGADGIEVIAELQRGDQVISASRVLRPDVAVLAVTLPGLDGFATAHALHEELPSCHSLIMSEQRDPGYLRRAVASHAVGLIVRDASPDFIAEAVRRVAKGRKVIDPDLAFAALNAEENPLTPRELDALRLAGQGATTAEIALELCLSVGTVRNYLSRVISKTGARNRVDAIRIANDSGWL
jgi:two-component system, NarL family, response regulator DesR